MAGGRALRGGAIVLDSISMAIWPVLMHGVWYMVYGHT